MSYALELVSVTHAFGDTTVLNNLSFEVQRGEIIGLCGDSGCGKTTTLRIIAGMLSPQRGQVLLDGVDATYAHPKHRHVGVVFQRPALFPDKQVRDNIALRLKLRRTPRDLCQALVNTIADELGVSNLLDRYPRELSGGQQQRVALAGEFVDERLKIILLDEPFNSLDRHTRVQLDEWTRAQIKRSGKSAIFVTHDPDEASLVCDRIERMEEGRLLEKN